MAGYIGNRPSKADIGVFTPNQQFNLVRRGVWNPPLSALSFDGSDDYVNYGDKADFEFASGQSFTIEFWQWQSSGSSIGSLITKGHGDPVGSSDAVPWYLSRTEYSGGFAEFFLRDSSNNNFSSQGTTDITDSWHHTAAVYDANDAELRLYVDGELEDTVTGVNEDSYGTNTDALLSGPHGGDYGGFELSDLRIWKGVARTQTEIQDNMNKRLNGDETGLVAYYKLDEGTGTTAYDSAGSNDGTINGATWVQETDLVIYE